MHRSIDDINKLAENPAEFIKKSDEAYDLMIYDAAKKILETSIEKPIVLLSGPSGSGKTTTALRIEALLESWGHKTHTLSMDNYYYRRADGVMPLDEEGNVDYESPLCLDEELLRSHLQTLKVYGSIDVPSFDFQNQCRTPDTTRLDMESGDIVVVEGIHALNPNVVGDVHDGAIGIYISVRTRVHTDRGFILHPSKVRLLRRLMRDQRGRGQSFEDTISRLRSVSRGERLYIMPVKHNADISMDTFCPYELCVLKDLLLGGLEKVDPEFMFDNDIYDVVPFLRQVTPLKPDGIGKEALLREFIGGGLLD